MTHQQFLETTVRLHEDQRYHSVDDRKLDIYQPPASIPGPYRVVLYIHGGALHIGHKSNARDFCTQMSLEGFLCVAPNYSLSSLSDDQLQSILTLVALIMLGLAVTSGTSMQLLFMLVLTSIIMLMFITMWTFVPREIVTHPAHIGDVAEAFRWVYDHAEEYQGDKNWMVVAGHSAGAQLASLLATNETYLQEQGLSLENIKACVGISGFYSDHRLKQLYLGKQLLQNAFGERDNYYDAFAIYNVTDRTPPFLLMNAASDIGLKQHSLDLHYTLMDHGVFSEIAYVNSATHFSIMKDLAPDQRHHLTVLKKIISFLAEIGEA